MTARFRVAATAFAALSLSGGGLAWGADPAGRFTMSPTDGGFVRLDRETGDMAFCKRADDGAWSCEAMADTQQAMRRELDRLQAENETLRRDGRTGRDGGPRDGEQDRSASRAVPRYAPEDPEPPEGGKIPMPSEEDVDKLFDYVERMAKKLKERMQKLEEQQGSGKGTPL